MKTNLFHRYEWSIKNITLFQLQ